MCFLHRFAPVWPGLVLLVLGTAVSVGPAAGERPLAGIATKLEHGEEPVKIVCIGDSITGVYYHTGGRRAYPEMLEIALKRAYPRAKVQVINAGISGNTLPQGLARLDRDVLAHKPHLVTIMYGMNDLTRSSRDEFKKNLTEMATRCRSAGAAVLLCTQNSIVAGRSPKVLADFTAAIHEVGRAEKLPVADCHLDYEGVRAKAPGEWALLMSDDIHPNMDGHKRFATVIARAITGKQDTLADVGPPTPAVPRTLARLRAGQPVKVLAMPPFDTAIGPALKEVDPKATAEVTPWPTDEQSVAQLRQAATKVRGMKPDLVIVAVPAGAAAATPAAFKTDYSWVLNNSLSFGKQEWDVIAAPPSTFATKLAETDRPRDALICRLIAAQDLSAVTRPTGDTTPLPQLLGRWLKDQAK